MLETAQEKCLSKDIQSIFHETPRRREVTEDLKAEITRLREALIIAKEALEEVRSDIACNDEREISFGTLDLVVAARDIAIKALEARASRV